MADNASLPQGGKPRRLGLYLPFAILALFIVGWTGFWFFSADLAGKITDNFIARESERGREWVCPNRQVGGYPFRIEISCARPQLLLKEGGQLRHEGSLGALSIHARILSPGHFIAVLSPPFVARRGAQADMEISWKSARASLRAGQESISEASVEFVEPVLSAGSGDRQDIRALAKGVELHMRRSPGDVPGTDLVSRVQDLTFAPFDVLTGTPDPIRLEVQATAPGLIPDPKHRFQDSLEIWRLAGGKARIVAIKATKGQAAIDLQGELGLDGLHRPEGHIQGRARGMDALLGRLTRRGGVDMGGLLGRMSGGQGLPVSLAFQDGWMRFGPFPLLPLDPLY